MEYLIIMKALMTRFFELLGPYFNVGFALGCLEFVLKITDLKLCVVCVHKSSVLRINS